MNVVKRWFLLAVISLATAPTVAQATTFAAPPRIQIIAVDAATAGFIDAPLFRWRTDGRALQFNASVSPFTLPVDVYFGVIIPGGRTFTWTTASTTGPVLIEGLHPAGQNLTQTDFVASASLGGAPRYAFSNGEPLGLYSLFVLVVLHGADPSDTSRWIAANMSPLILSE